MKIAVWKTGHEIADRVADDIVHGLQLPRRYNKCSVDLFTTEIGYHENVIETPDLHIGYGILRGMSDVFHAASKAGKPWVNVDRGYWKPGHYDGYYRFSLNGTQQTKFKGLEPDYKRWDALGIEIVQERLHAGDFNLVCPPSNYVNAFYDLNWHPKFPINSIFRQKGNLRELQSDLDSSFTVQTFNSSVGWEALRQGIPVISDPTHSIVGAYQKTVDKPLHLDSNARRDLFALMAGLQLRLNEIRSGMLWPLLHKLLMSSSVGTPERLSQDMSPLTQFFVAQPHL